MKKLLIGFVLAGSFLLQGCDKTAEGVSPEVLKEGETEEVETKLAKIIDGNYTLSTAASEVRWIGRKIVGMHAGTVALGQGNFVIEDGLAVSGEITADMNRIKSTDLEGPKAKSLEDHLMNEDFFDTANFPTSQFVLKNSEHVSGDVYRIEGDLTIIGATRPISFDSTVRQEEDGISLRASLNLNRTLWGIKFKSASFFEGLGDKAIRDYFDLSVDLVFEQE